MNSYLVQAFRAFAYRNHAMRMVNRRKAKRFIDEAISDISDKTKPLKNTPFVFFEYTCGHLAAANIYAKLAATEEDAEEAKLLASKSNEFRKLAVATKADLKRFRDERDAHLALIYLLQQTEQDEELRDLANEWRSQEVSVYVCGAFAVEFLRMKDYANALLWAERARSKHPDRFGFLLVYVKLMDPNRTISVEDLRKEVLDNLERKLKNGATAHLRFDIQQSILFGDYDALEHYGKDEVSRILMDGQTFEPHCRYFCLPEKRSLDAAQLIEECAKVPQPVSARSHANFALALEAMSLERWADARTHFEACVDDDYYPFYVHWLSRAFLAYSVEEWNNWLR